MRALGLVLAALLLAGCGSQATPASSYSSIGALAQDACKTYTPQPQPMLYAADTYDCTSWNGRSVVLNWFNNDTARDNYVKVGTANGAAYVEGHLWVVECQDNAAQTEETKLTSGKPVG